MDKQALLKEHAGNVRTMTYDDKVALNAYRVLLTRARQGMVVFIPEGDESDRTRNPEFYEPVFQYFIQCGVPCI